MCRVVKQFIVLQFVCESGVFWRPVLAYALAGRVVGGLYS
jgi:hypothetical protein